MAEQNTPSELSVRLVSVGRMLHFRCVLSAWHEIDLASGVRFKVTRFVEQTNQKDDVTLVEDGKPTQQAKKAPLEVTRNKLDRSIKNQFSTLTIEFEVRLGAGEVALEATYRPMRGDGKPGREVRLNAKSRTAQVNNLSTGKVPSRRPLPRLIHGLNAAPVPEAVDSEGLNFAAPGAREISFICRHLVSRLEDGLDAMWMKIDRRARDIPLNAAEHDADLLERLKRASPEEFLNEDQSPFTEDDPPTETIPGSGDPFRGIGTRPEVRPHDLEELVKLWSRSRPLGMARLLLIRSTLDVSALGSGPTEVAKIAAAKDQWLLYASPLVRMYTDTASFTRARYAWSLRCLPGRRDITAVWLISAPREALANAMIKGDRRDSLQDLIDRVGGPILNTKAGKKIVSVSEYLANYTRPVLDLISRRDGTALMTFKWGGHPPTSAIRSVMEKLAPSVPWDAETGVTSGTDPYFSQEWAKRSAGVL